MPITFVGEADAAAATVTLPSFTAGDIAVVFAFRFASSTAPSLPAGWTSIHTNNTGAGSTAALRSGYRVLLSGDTDTGTWTNATAILVVVLRGQDASTPSAAIGASTSAMASSNALSFTTIALQVTNGTSWVLCNGAHGTATDVNTVALTGTTNRTGSTTSVCAHTAENVSTWPTTAKTVNATEAQGRAIIEIRAAAVRGGAVGQAILSGVHSGIL